MGDVFSYETPILSIDEFSIGLLEKDRVDGLLIRCDENGYYNIGIQINDKEVVKVDSAAGRRRHAQDPILGGKSEQVRRQYKSREPQLGPFRSIAANN